MYRSSWCEIDLARFRQNLSQLRKQAGTKALLVVKANAYGHGLVPMSREAEAVGIDMLGVATVGEAFDLLEAGLSTPILVMCALDFAEIDYCVARGIHFMAWSNEHFRHAMKAAERYGSAPRIHVEVDTGMSRSGIAADELPSLLESLASEELQAIVGVMTHFHSADLAHIESAQNQLADFRQTFDVIIKAGLTPLFHAANSPGSIRLPESRLDMVRLGIAAYGLLPSDFTPLPAGVSPVLTWKANVTNVKRIEIGQGVGYAWKYVANESHQVATLGIGYADGFRRSPHGVNTTIVRGAEAAVIGSVFMDQCVFRVPNGLRCEVGDTTTVLGSDGGLNLTAERIAERWQTNNYDVVAGIRSRVPRRYLNGFDKTINGEKAWLSD
jgi:alanine racemase